MFLFSPALLVWAAVPIILANNTSCTTSEVPTQASQNGTTAATTTVTSFLTGNATIPTTSTAAPTFTSTSAPTPGKLRGVVENSGICETTKGVAQASGYADLTATSSMWFWYFAARKNPDTAPLTLWFNGGPGSSSMDGLFQEIGPCRITDDSSTVKLNPFAWNTISNIIFIDQPIGAGFSHGTSTVSTTFEAASDVWDFLQIFLADSRFRKLRGRKIQIWTESYGGHYGPTFTELFRLRNFYISPFSSQVRLPVEVLGIGNGITDALIQYPSYISYAQTNSYHPLVTQSEIATGEIAWTKKGGCRDQIIACNSGDSDAVCSAAQTFCNDNLLGPLHGDYNVYYVPSKDYLYPPKFSKYLESIRPKIGAEVEWVESSPDVLSRFTATGDWMSSVKLFLEFIVGSDVRTVLYAGDADYIVNYQGVEALVDSLNTRLTSIYKKATWQPFFAPASKYANYEALAGQYKCAGTFTYIRFYGAGHMVPAYGTDILERGEAAFEMFKRATNGEPYLGCS